MSMLCSPLHMWNAWGPRYDSVFGKRMDASAEQPKKAPLPIWNRGGGVDGIPTRSSRTQCLKAKRPMYRRPGGISMSRSRVHPAKAPCMTATTDAGSVTVCMCKDWKAKGPTRTTPCGTCTADTLSRTQSGQGHPLHMAQARSSWSFRDAISQYSWENSVHPRCQANLIGWRNAKNLEPSACASWGVVVLHMRRSNESRSSCSRGMSVMRLNVVTVA